MRTAGLSAPSYLYSSHLSPPSAFLLFTQASKQAHPLGTGTTMADVGVNDGGGGAGGGAAGGGQARRVVDALGQVVRGRFTDFLQTFRVRVYMYYGRAAATYEWASMPCSTVNCTVILKMHSHQDIPSLPLPCLCCSVHNSVSPHLKLKNFAYIDINSSIHPMIP